MKIKIINKSNNELPSYTTVGSAGMDVRCFIPDISSDDDCSIGFPDSITLLPMERKMIHTGLYFEIPEGYELQIRPRSGLAIKNGITIINTPGTLDSDYRGELCILLMNLSTEPFIIHNGDRIAQIIINKYEKADWIETEILSETERGSGGFNSTGTK
jgi:dUTP pyrophosphatase